jgi:hypothetical protein
MLLSIGDRVRPGTYRFHSRFNRAVNFECRGRLIAVVDEAIGPGPLNIVLRDLGRASVPASPNLSGHRENQGSRGRSPSQMAGLANPPPPLRVTAHTVLFAGRRYHFTARHRYDSTLDCEVEDLRRFQHNLAALGELLRNASPPKSLAFLLASQRRKNFRAGFERAFAEQIRRGVRQVFHGSLLEGIRQLKGCGLGLTPAGDDLIAGLLIGLHLLQKLHGQNFQPAANAVFRAARGDNIFSNAFLDLARRGLLFGTMKDLLLALVSGSEGSVRKAARKLFGVGASSGADLATGLFMTVQAEECRMWKECRKQKAQESGKDSRELLAGTTGPRTVPVRSGQICGRTTEAIERSACARPCCEPGRFAVRSFVCPVVLVVPARYAQGQQK